MRILYQTVLYLALPFIFLRLYLKGRRLPAYRARWSERLGILKTPPLHNSIWIHAASVGETVAATPLVMALKKAYPDTPIIFTSMTPTGSDTVARLLSQHVTHSYAPYDFPHSIQRFLTHNNPTLLILMETELWPNYLHYCAQKNIPVVLANGRLSARSAKEYQKISPLVRTMLQHITTIAAQSDRDAQRFISLGAPTERVYTVGNIKCNVSLPENLEQDGIALRNHILGEARPIWIAASTHEGEEAMLLTVFSALKKTQPDLLLLLVPRHPERFSSVARLCTDHGYTTVRRSSGQPCTEHTDIFLGDTMGELMLFYAASDIAFVGGSLVPIGGHNLIEPAVLGLPIITGIHTFNSTEISALLQTAEATTQANTPEALEAQMRTLLENPALQQHRGKAAQTTVAQHTQALERHMALIRNARAPASNPENHRS